MLVNLSLNYLDNFFANVSSSRARLLIMEGFLALTIGEVAIDISFDPFHHCFESLIDEMLPC